MLRPITQDELIRAFEKGYYVYDIKGFRYIIRQLNSIEGEEAKLIQVNNGFVTSGFTKHTFALKDIYMETDVPIGKPIDPLNSLIRQAKQSRKNLSNPAYLFMLNLLKSPPEQFRGETHLFARIFSKNYLARNLCRILEELDVLLQCAEKIEVEQVKDE